MNDKVKIGLIFLSVILVGCGIGMMIIGYDETEYDYKGIICTICDGYGCKFCNGVGSILGNDFTYSANSKLGLIFLVIGAAVGIFLFKMPYSHEPSAPTHIEGVSENAVQFNLYDASYKPGYNKAPFAMKYTFTDADTGAVLGRGKQFDVLILNINKPTRIKCGLNKGWGYKDVIINYVPRENAKYIVYPNPYCGIQVEEIN